MEKKFLSKAKLYRYVKISWWNDGSERKPSKKQFDNYAWYVLNRNFNVKWVSLFSIILTVPKEFEYNFFRLEYTTPHFKDPVNEYYYVEKVLDINSKNKKLLLTIDIWCSYIINRLPVTDDQQLYNLKVQTNRYLKDNKNSSSVSSHKSPLPYGYPTGKTSYETVSWLNPGETLKDSGFWNGFDVRFNDNFNVNLYGYRQSPKILPKGFYKYYAFLTQNTTESVYVGVGSVGSTYILTEPSPSHNVVLFPVLFEWCGDLVARNSTVEYDMKFRPDSAHFTCAWEFKPKYKSQSPLPKKDLHIYLYNDEFNLIRLAERLNEHKNWSGLSKFLGVFYGDSYFRKTTRKKSNGNNEYYFESYEDDLTVSRYKIKAKINGRVYEDFKIKNFQLMSGRYDNTIDKTILSGFACVKIGHKGLSVVNTDYDYLRRVYDVRTKNYNILGDPEFNYNMGVNRVYFTDRLIYTNGYDLKELNSEVPLLVDDYYNVLQATKPQRDAALRSAATSLATSAVKDWLPPAIHGQGVYAEKTAWGNYWDTQADYLNVKSATGFMSQLHPEDWVVSPKGSVLKPWANTNSLLDAQKNKVVGASLKGIGSADKLMGKISGGLGIASSVANVIGSTLQFANTLYGLKKQVEQIRLETSTNLTSTSSSYLMYKYYYDRYDISFDWDVNKTDEENRNELNKKVYRDVLIGTEYEDKYGLYSYYGQEVFYEEKGITIGKLEDGWINMSDGEMLYRKLYQWYKGFLRNDIIDAIVKMLTQGVRVLPEP